MSAPHVFVLIDALGWELLRERPFAPDFLPHRQPVCSLLGFSSGIIPSILTGLTPAQSGMWNLVYYDPEHSPFRWMRMLGASLPRALDNRVTRRLLTELGRRVLGVGANFDVSVPLETLPYFNWVEGRNIYAGAGVKGHDSIFDLLAERKVPHRIYSYKDGLSDAEILSHAERDLRRSDARFFFLYLSELDMFLHTHRKDAARVEEKLAWYEQQLVRVFSAARERGPEASFHVFSDHGMTPVERHCDLAAEVRACGFRSPRDYLAVYDSTMARFWYFNEAAREKITAKLNALDYARLLSEDELRALGVWFADGRYGEQVLLLKPGCIIAESGFNGHGWKPAGMHGYHPQEDPNANASYLASEAPATPLETVRNIFTIMQEAAR